MEAAHDFFVRAVLRSSFASKRDFPQEIPFQGARKSLQQNTQLCLIMVSKQGTVLIYTSLVIVRSA